MEGWLGVVGGAILVVMLLGGSLALLALRRRWVARDGGTFECSVRLRPGRPGIGWVLGVARYRDNYLEWFRFFSYSFRPRLSFPRSQVRVLESREPDPGEALALYADQRVALVEVRSATFVHAWELAMHPDSLTGLLSWLEAAPPGVRQRH